MIVMPIRLISVSAVPLRKMQRQHDQQQAAERSRRRSGASGRRPLALAVGRGARAIGLVMSRGSRASPWA